MLGYRLAFYYLYEEVCIHDQIHNVMLHSCLAGSWVAQWDLCV